TSMINPIDLDSDPNTQYNNLTDNTYLYINGQGADHGVINASAVEYYEAWASQWESGLPHFPSALLADIETVSYESGNIEPIPAYGYGFNPYLYNVRGEWRAKKSYAYLTGRNNNENSANPLRHEGYFNKFKPLYRINTTTLDWYVDNPQNDLD